MTSRDLPGGPVSYIYLHSFAQRDWETIGNLRASPGVCLIIFGALWRRSSLQITYRVRSQRSPKPSAVSPPLLAPLEAFKGLPGTSESTSAELTRYVQGVAAMIDETFFERRWEKHGDDESWVAMMTPYLLGGTEKFKEVRTGAETHK